MEAQKNKKKGLKMIKISTYRVIICLMVIALTGGMLALAPSLVTPVMADEGTGMDNPWLTFLGGYRWDEGRGIAVDADGNIYVTGSSYDSWGTPVRAHSGYIDAFVVRLNSKGELESTGPKIHVRANGVSIANGDVTPSLTDHTDFGGIDIATGTVVRTFTIENNGYADLILTGNPRIGITGVNAADFSVTVQPVSPVAAGSSTTFTVTFDPSTIGLKTATISITNNDCNKNIYTFAIQGTGIIPDNPWLTFLGGNSNDEGRGIVVDASGNIYVTGGSDASWGSPVRAYLGNTDSFVAKLGSDGGLLWNTFLGSSKYDFGHNIAVNAGGNAYVTGVSDASWDTPLRPHSGGSDAFVVKLNSKGELESTGPKINLTISKSGTGSGSVTSNPAGINCGSTCSATFPKDTTINLTATPAEGSVFVGWAGDCTGAGTNLVCALTMDASKNVTARFDSKTPTYVIELLRGWNFISLPVEPSDTSITAVLKDISSSVRIVWGYDNQNKTWKRFRPGGENNNLGDMMMNKGYWIYMNTPETLIIEGQPSDPQAVTLYKGWNLTGYNGQDNKDVSQALESVAGRWTLIWNWDNGGWYARHESDLELSVAPLGALNLKKAYWILMKEAGEWQQ